MHILIIVVVELGLVLKMFMKKIELNKIKSKIKGFSLIELSIVLMILALSISTSLSLSYSINNKDKYDLTVKNMERIHKALVVFLGINGRLPCPASPAVSILNSVFGQELTVAGTPQSCNTTFTNVNIFTGNVNGATQYYGMAPVATLGLQDDVAFDGWGNRIGYVVTQAFANSSNTNTSCTAASPSNSNATANICFKGQPNNSSYVPQMNTDGFANTYSKYTAYILISHGENGYGAFLKESDVDYDNGGTDGPNANRNSIPPTSNPNELQNLNCTSSAVCTSNGLNSKYVQGEISTPIFDDIVMFKNRNQLLYECNKYGGNACTLNEGIFPR